MSGQDEGSAIHKRVQNLLWDCRRHYTSRTRMEQSVLHNNSGANETLQQEELSQMMPGATREKLHDMVKATTRSKGKQHVVQAQLYTQGGKHEQAVTEFAAAARLGDPEGMYNYGICLLKGQGVRCDIPSAVSWFRKAAAADPTALKEIQDIGELVLQRLNILWLCVILMEWE